jgi:Tol biopolymer transport system component
MLVTPFSKFAWSSNSSQIVYVAPGDVNDDIFIANSDGSNVINLTAALGNKERDPDWSLVLVP